MILIDSSARLGKLGIDCICYGFLGDCPNSGAIFEEALQVPISVARARLQEADILFKVFFSKLADEFRHIENCDASVMGEVVFLPIALPISDMDGARRRQNQPVMSDSQNPYTSIHMARA